MTRRYWLQRLLSKPRKWPVGQHTEKLEALLGVGGNGKWCSCCAECGGYSKIKNRLDTGSSSSISVYTQKNWKRIRKAAIFIPTLTAPSFITGTVEKQSKPTNEWRGKIWAPTYNGILFCLKKDKFLTHVGKHLRIRYCSMWNNQSNQRIHTVTKSWRQKRKVTVEGCCPVDTKFQVSRTKRTTEMHKMMSCTEHHWAGRWPRS